MPDRLPDAEIARLRQVAENPFTRPSERVEARKALAPYQPRRLAGHEKQDALTIARAMLREMGFE